MKASILGLQFIMFFSFLGMVAQNAEQSVVKIKGFGDGEGNAKNLEIGGGIITGFNNIANEVFIVTAFHVVGERDSLTVEFHQYRNEFPATIFKVEPELDLAVIRVNVTGTSIDFKKLVVAESSDFKISLVKVIGHPQGSSWLTGIYNFISPSDTHRFTISNRENEADEEIREIGKGHSGGGVFTKNNRLMGMMLENRSHNALVLDLLPIMELLKEWKVETNLLTKPKIKLGTIAVIGSGTAGVLVSLLHFEKESKDLYKIYEENRFANDQIYADMGTTRENVFTDAESKHKTAVIVGAVSGTILAVGTYILIKKLNKRKKEKRHDGLVVVPHFDMPNYVSSSGNAVTAGVTIRF